MKIKFLSLLLIFAGLIIVTACTIQAQPFMFKGSEDSYREISYSHNRSMENGDGHIRMHHPGHFFENPYSKPHMHNLEKATFILDRNIEKAENTSLRLESGIQRYKAQGKNVSNLESALNEYNLLINEAKQHRASANSSNESDTSNITNISDKSIKEKNYKEKKYDFITLINIRSNSSKDAEREYLIESQKSMIKANIILENLFEEFQNLSSGNEELNNTSRLRAAGKGRGFLMGGFTLNLHVEDGEVAIPKFSPDSEINVEGNYTLELKNGTRGEMRVYRIQSADVNISGSHKTIMLKGENLSINANGEGYSDFVGTGIYRIEDSEGIEIEDAWEMPFFKKEMDREEFEPPEFDLHHDEFKPPFEDEMFDKEFESSRQEIERIEHQIDDFEPSDHEMSPDEFKPSEEESDSNELKTFEDEMDSDNFEPSGDEFNPDELEPSNSEIDVVEPDSFEPSKDEIDQVEDQIDQIEKQMESDNFEPPEGDWL